MDRRDFFKTTGAGLTAAGALLTNGEAAAQPASWSEKDKLARLAGCTWPIRSIFKSRQGGGRGGGGRGAGAPAATATPAPAAGTASSAAPAAATRGTAAAAAAAPVAQRSPSNGGWTPQQMKEKYGEITMLDF